MSLNSIFLKLLQMSPSACWMTAAVILLRFLFKNAPKNMRCILWGLAGLRLVCPFSIESVFSLIPRTETASQPLLFSRASDSLPAAHPPSGGSHLTAEFLQTFPSAPDTSASDSLRTLLTVCTTVWAAGAAVFILYALISSLVLYHRLRESIWLKENIWLCDRIDAPFIYGIFRPRICLPSDIQASCAAYATAHEKAHLARHDHWTKLLGYLLLAVYWFHPAVWAAYILFCKDIELACDEKVIQNFDMHSRKEYSAALLDLSISRRTLAACPPAFSEGNVKERVKEVLHYKKPALWVLLAASVCCIAFAACFLTDPVSGKTPSIQNTDSEQYRFTEKWARAFINRDGKAISQMLAKSQYEEWGFQPDSDYYSFGFSSPWPWDDEQDYVIRSVTEEGAEVLYYAHTSDPHVTVWKDTLAFGTENGSLKVVKSGLYCFDEISSRAEFMDACPEIKNTGMDYLANGLAAALEQNAPQYAEELDRILKNPETAAVFLLNLSPDNRKTSVTLKSIDEKQQNAIVEAVFAKDNSQVEISMYSPKKGGIWIPQDAR